MSADGRRPLALPRGRDLPGCDSAASVLPLLDTPPSFQAGTKRTVDDLLLHYPGLASRVMLDHYPTAERGQRLYALILTNARATTGQSKGKVLVVSSIHARELATAETGECSAPGKRARYRQIWR